MSKDGFLKRWSRRKQGEPGAEPKPDEPRAPPTAASPEPVVSEPPPPEEDIDPATLPPIESLGAESDYTMFLKKGVPEALRLAALRKAWMSDAFIRDFRSPAIEYGWDFTTPDYSLRATDDVAKLLDGIFGTRPQPAKAAEAPASEPAPAPPAAAEAAEPPRLAEAPAQPPPAGTHRATEPAPEMLRRKHGGALPS